MRSSDHVVSVALGGHIMLFLMDLITQTFDFYDKGVQPGVGESRLGAYCPKLRSAGQTTSWIVSC